MTFQCRLVALLMLGIFGVAIVVAKDPGQPHTIRTRWQSDGPDIPISS